MADTGNGDRGNSLYSKRSKEEYQELILMMIYMPHGDDLWGITCIDNRGYMPYNQIYLQGDISPNCSG